MAQTSFRANTQSSVMPLLSDLSTQTVIMGQQDQTFVPNVNPSDQVSPVERGIPEMFYCENVMPSTYGYQSIGYTQRFPAAPSAANFQEVYPLRSTDKINTYLAWDYELSKKLWVIRDGAWYQIPNSPTIDGINTSISIATVNGVDYITVARKGTFTYSNASGQFTQVVLNTLNDSEIVGSAASNGYLLMFSVDGISWSSNSDPLEFDPESTDLSGAGGGKLQEAKGDFVCAIPTSYGCIIYTTKNAISVTYSGNVQFPFNYKEISGAGGLAGSWMVTKETSGQQYAYTTNGLQQVYHTGAKTILAYVTDFLAGSVFEDFDRVNKKFITNVLSGTMRKKLALVSDRYLVISYGMRPDAQMTHALVVDVTQSRMGKLKITHNAAFQVTDQSPEVVETPRESIALLNANGETRVVDFNVESLAAQGLIFFGKYQLIRARNLNMQEVQIENANGGSEVVCEIYPTLDGKTFMPPVTGFPTPESAGKRVKSWFFDLEGTNHSVCFTGAFNIIGMELFFQPSSRRR